VKGEKEEKGEGVVGDLGRKKRRKKRERRKDICQHCEIDGLFCLLGVLITVLSF
jgi:hypothetical protein